MNSGTLSRDDESVAAWCLDAAERLVDRLRGHAAIPPVRVDAIAALVGIQKVVETSLPYSGRIVPIGTKYIVELNAEEHPVRKRFTLGHEIGHVLLASRDNRHHGQQFLRCGRNADLEKYCDLIGASLLLPRRELVDVLGDHSLSIHLLREATRVFEVSWSALAIRIAGLYRTYSFVRWTYAPGGRNGDVAFRVKWSATPDGIFIPSMAKARDERLIRDSLTAGRPVEGSIKLNLGSLRGVYRAGVTPIPMSDQRESDALMLVEHPARTESRKSKTT